MPISKSPKALPSHRPGKSGGKRDENRKRQVAKLGKAGLVLFCERGLEAVSVDDIVRKAKVAKGSFYRYFSDKSELVEALFSPSHSQIQVALDLAQSQTSALQSPADLTRVYGSLASTIAVLVSNNPEVLQLYLQENRGPDIEARRPILNLSKLIDDAGWQMTLVAQKHGLLRSSYNAKLGSLSSIGSIERLLLAYRRQETDLSAAEMSSAVIEIILDGVR